MVLLELSEQRYLANRPLPVSPTGLYDEQAQAFTERDGLDDNHSILNNLVNRAKGDVKRGLPLPADPAILDAFADKIINKDAIDDRKGLFTAGLSALSRLPPGSDLGKKLNDDAITLLYTTLPHPPQNFVGESRFRTADGSGNNPHIPNLGKAGTHYAKSVQSKHPFPAHTLPDPALVFDTLLRADKQTPHPGGNSSLTFAWASLVTHSLFRTNKDFTINDTSSYLDLSPLYGSNQVEQDSIRNKDGRGMLWPDVFSEARMQSLPPATAALLVIFSRNHNYIANNILNINEKKRWSNPPPTDSAKLATQDEEIFQTARLINCGHFMSIIFGDYVSGFLGMPRDGNTWSMNPFDPIKAPDGEHIGRGEGNHCSVEFNVLYRWHATVSAADEKWTETTFNRLFDNKPHDQLTLGDVFGALEKARGQIDPDPRKRTFAGLVRGPGGRFNDADIAGILHSAIENVAGAYGARRIPPVLRIVEILGMEQARKWSCCSMNEFRKFLGLKKFDTFEDWNPDPEIAGAARKLYGHIDNLELYPGLQAEAVMPLGPGQGLCAGYTTTRAILSDAIALVRGDRFYTTDFTPENLTSWGFQDCARDPNNGAFGAHLPKLLLRNLPFHMPWNSTYSLFPFFTPQAMKENLQRLRDAGKINNYDQYDFGKPGVVSIPRPINTLTGIRNVFNDSERFPTTYGNDMRFLTQGYGFFLVFEDALRHDKDKAMVLHALFPTKESMAKYTAFYRSKALALIQEKSFTYHNKPGKYLDIVRQVINLVSVHWAAELLCGIPLKTKANPSGLFTEQEVYDMFAILFTCVFKNTVPEESWSLRLQAAQAGKIVTDFIEKALAEVSPASSGGLSGILGSISSAIWPTTPRPAHEFLSKLTETGRPIKELSANVLGLAVGSSVNYAQAIAQVVDFYLEDKNVKEREHLIQLCQKDDAASNELIKGYIREAQRLEPQFAGLLRDVASDATIDLGAGEKLSVKKGDRIFASYRNAHLNPVDFPDPQKIDPTRPRTNYAVQGTGFHGCPGVNFTEQTAPEIIKAIFRLKNIRRVPGDAGKLAGFTKNVLGTNNRVFINQVGQLSSWPGSLFVVYDE